MSINGKRDNITRENLVIVGKEMSIKSQDKIMDEIVEVISKWPDFAKEAGVSSSQIRSIGQTHRLL